MKEISREYAEALFALSLENDEAKSDYQALELVQEMFDENPMYPVFLATPSIPKEERIKALKEAFEGNIPERVMTMLCLFCEKGHIMDFAECREEYKELLLAYEARSIAKVSSAIPLSDEEKRALSTNLEKKFGHSIELECSIDESLIGGMVVEIEGKVIDGSLKSRLRQIKEAIKG